MPLPLDELVVNPRLVNERAQDVAWDELLYEYERALDDDVALLNGLTEDQIHFKPTTKAFSIAEVVTHSTGADRLFWSWVRLLATRQRAAIDPAALIPGGGARDDLSLDQVRGEIEACRSLARETVETVSEPIDLVATSPHPYFGELNAKGWIYFMTLHHGLHLRQCEGVIDTPGFPVSNSRQSLTPDEYLQPRDRKTWLVEKPEARGQKRRVRSQKAAVGSKRPKAENKKQDEGSRKQEAGNKQRKSESAKKRISESAKERAVVKKKPAGQTKQSSRKTTAKR